MGLSQTLPRPPKRGEGLRKVPYEIAAKRLVLAPNCSFMVLKLWYCCYILAYVGIIQNTTTVEPMLYEKFYAAKNK